MQTTPMLQIWVDLRLLSQILMFIFVEDLMFGFGMPINLMDEIMWKTSQNIDFHSKAEMNITYMETRKTAPKSLA